MALGDLGYTWGQTIQVICRSAEGSHERLGEVATAPKGYGVAPAPWRSTRGWLPATAVH
jgi:hypothetical protein